MSKDQRKTECTILTGRKGISSPITMAMYSVMWGCNLQVISVPKEFLLKEAVAHSIKHETTYGKYHGNSRKAILKQLKSNQIRNQGGCNQAITSA